MRLSGCGLVRSSPEGPGDGVSGLDACTPRLHSILFPNAPLIKYAVNLIEHLIIFNEMASQAAKMQIVSGTFSFGVRYV